MDKEEFKILRKKLKLTQAKLASLLEISPRTVQEYEYGNLTISLAIAELLRGKAKNTIFNSNSKIEMDVTNKDKVSLEEIAQFCIKHKKNFMEIPEIKLLIDYERKDAKAELMEKHIILKNNENISKK
ncbi:helix-turn-helix domain-containing protein [Aquimarina longa]|uniref:helix-turn-helix domain-containing protein n=1 Tax=Aquimarina longa TaxID=1080221 RepID=UPI0007853FDA|nr:helix-turn-helix transcriptional regulator [Aquimarina longa]